MAKYALITGATSGIGKEMAIYLHRLGWRLVLSGRNETVLKRMAARFGQETKYLAIDLAQPDAPQKLYNFCKGTRIDMLVNNAGFGVFGNFADSDLDAELRLIDVNIRAVHILMKLFLRDMVARDSGVILNTGSIAGFSTGPMLSSYYASKNYVVRMTTAVREELRRRGSHVTVSVLCPGPVDTDFNNRAGVTFSVRPTSPVFVAQYGIDRALAGQCIILPTLMVKLGAVGMKLCPEELAARIVYLVQKRKEKNA